MQMYRLENMPSVRNIDYFDGSSSRRAKEGRLIVPRQRQYVQEVDSRPCMAHFMERPSAKCKKLSLKVTF